MIRFPLISLALMCACSPASLDPAPVGALGSTSLCADSYLIALAPERAAALSWQAGSALSTAPDSMADLPRLWNSREVLARTEIGLITGPGDSTFGREDALSLEWGEDFETVRTNLHALHENFGIDISGPERELDNLLMLPKPETPPRVLYLSRAGGSAGPGTFVNAVIQAAGGENINTAPGWHTPSVERVLQFNPDVILTSFFGSDYAGANDRALRHSALRRYMAKRPRVDLPGKLWPCAGPGLIDAAKTLNEALMSL